MSTLYIKNVILRGFKSIEEVTTDLQPGLNILIGKNGAGKSNFLGLIKIAMQSAASGRHANFKSAEVVFSTSHGREFVYSVVRNTSKALIEEPEALKYVKTLRFEGEYIYNSKNPLPAVAKKIGTRTTAPRSVANVFNRLKVPYRLPKFIEFKTSEDLDGLSIPLSLEIPFDYDSFWPGTYSDTLILSRAIMSFESNLVERLRALDSSGEEDDGEVTEKWNEILTSINPENFLESTRLNQEVIEDLKKFTPIEDVRLNKSVSIFRNDSELIIENIRLDFLVNGNWLPWNQLSDGTKRIFLLVSEVAQTNSGVILVEEPELGIHPHQFALVMQFLKEQSEGKQIIISTHSPKALDILEIDQLDSILLAEYQKGYGTVINHMSEEQKAKAISYVEEVGFLSDFWLMSDLEL